MSSTGEGALPTSVRSDASKRIAEMQHARGIRRGIIIGCVFFLVVSCFIVSSNTSRSVKGNGASETTPKLLILVANGLNPDYLETGVQNNRAPFMAMLRSGGGILERVSGYTSEKGAWLVRLLTGSLEAQGSTLGGASSFLGELTRAGRRVAIIAGPQYWSGTRTEADGKCERVGLFDTECAGALCPSANASYYCNTFAKYQSCGNLSLLYFDEVWKGFNDAVAKGADVVYVQMDTFHVSEHDEPDPTARALRIFSEVNLLDSTVGKISLFVAKRSKNTKESWLLMLTGDAQNEVKKAPLFMAGYAHGGLVQLGQVASTSDLADIRGTVRHWFGLTTTPLESKRIIGVCSDGSNVKNCPREQGTRSRNGGGSDGSPAEPSPTQWWGAIPSSSPMSLDKDTIERDRSANSASPDRPLSSVAVNETYGRLSPMQGAQERPELGTETARNSHNHSLERRSPSARNDRGSITEAGMQLMCNHGSTVVPEMQNDTTSEASDVSTDKRWVVSRVARTWETARESGHNRSRCPCSTPGAGVASHEPSKVTKTSLGGGFPQSSRRRSQDNRQPVHFLSASSRKFSTCLADEGHARDDPTLTSGRNSGAAEAPEETQRNDSRITSALSSVSKKCVEACKAYPIDPGENVERRLPFHHRRFMPQSQEASSDGCEVVNLETPMQCSDVQLFSVRSPVMASAATSLGTLSPLHAGQHGYSQCNRCLHEGDTLHPSRLCGGISCSQRGKRHPSSLRTPSAFFSLAPYILANPIATVHIEVQPDQYHAVHLYAKDDPHKVAIKFSQEHQLDPAVVVEPLTEFLAAQMQIHRGTSGIKSTSSPGDVKPLTDTIPTPSGRCTTAPNTTERGSPAKAPASTQACPLNGTDSRVSKRFCVVNSLKSPAVPDRSLASSNRVSSPTPRDTKAMRVKGDTAGALRRMTSTKSASRISESVSPDRSWSFSTLINEHNDKATSCPRRSRSSSALQNEKPRPIEKCQRNRSPNTDDSRPIGPNLCKDAFTKPRIAPATTRAFLLRQRAALSRREAQSTDATLMDDYAYCARVPSHRPHGTRKDRPRGQCLPYDTTSSVRQEHTTHQEHAPASSARRVRNGSANLVRTRSPIAPSGQKSGRSSFPMPLESHRLQPTTGTKEESVPLPHQERLPHRAQLSSLDDKYYPQPDTPTRSRAMWSRYVDPLLSDGNTVDRIGDFDPPEVVEPGPHNQGVNAATVRPAPPLQSQTCGGPLLTKEVFPYSPVDESEPHSSLLRQIRSRSLLGRRREGRSSPYIEQRGMSRSKDPKLCRSHSLAWFDSPPPALSRLPSLSEREYFRSGGSRH